MSGKRIISIIAVLILAGGALFYFAQISTDHKFSSPFTFIQSKPQLSLLVVGDIMLDRNVKLKIDAIGFDKFFEGVKELLIKPDLTVGNLEGPFTNFPSVVTNLKNKALVFTFDPAFAPKLAEHGFDILGLANNHTLNFGKEGMVQTKKYLQDANIFYYGDPNNRDALSVITEKNGIVLGFVGFHEFSYINFDKVIVEIERIRPQVDFLIVTPHWGPEYEKSPTEKMQTWAHEWIDKGADVVIGAHSHVIGDIEEYNGKKIFYSLGNFVFDQYFSKETSEGLVVKIDLEKGSDKIEARYTLTRVVIGKEGVTVSE